jgi:hypothetical protein
LERQHCSIGHPRDDPGHLLLGRTVIRQQSQERDTAAGASLLEDLGEGFHEPV